MYVRVYILPEGTEIKQFGLEVIDSIDREETVFEFRDVPVTAEHNLQGQRGQCETCGEEWIREVHRVLLLVAKDRRQVPAV